MPPAPAPEDRPAEDRPPEDRPAGAGATLVLLRHGESEWNMENRFTGWHDVGLSERGVGEARRAGAALADAGVEPTVVHTSVLVRAIATANEALAAMGRLWLPVKRFWRLNERHYGALTGLDKAETAELHGAEQVRLWRRSYDVAPPPMPADHPFNPGADPRYADVPAAEMPAGECLADVVERMRPYRRGALADDLAAGETVLVAAHGNSLRALVKELDGIGDEDIAGLDIPTGVPLLYELDGEMAPRHAVPVEQRYLV